MLITKKTISSLYTMIRRLRIGNSRTRVTIELGERGNIGDLEGVTPNMLFWEEEADLDDTIPLEGYRDGEIEEDEYGFALVDCYVYQRDAGLITNVYALINSNSEIVCVGYDYNGVMESHRQEVPRVVVIRQARQLSDLPDDTPLWVVADKLQEEGHDVSDLRAIIGTPH